MTACQVTELPSQALKNLPAFYRFHLYSPEDYPYFLSSTSRSEPVGSDIHQGDSNFDILFIRPEQRLILEQDRILTYADNSPLLNQTIDRQKGFLDNFNSLYQASAAEESSEFGFLPFRGGWFIFLSYELAQEVEPVLTPLMSNNQVQQCLPMAYAARVRQALIFDHQKNRLFFVTEQGIEHKVALQALQKDIKQIQSEADSLLQIEDFLLNLQEEPEQPFLSSVERVRKYIRDGDVFQVNMSRLWQADICSPERSNSPEYRNSHKHSDFAASVYKKLSRSNPAPFSGLAGFKTESGRASIISSSPERLLSIKNNRLESRPIAGTHPRGISDEEDQRLMERLHNHPKEQAEHIMLIDLIRNDLGRVCVPGTVQVDELMVNESYAHVHHIVSNVVGELQKDKTPVDAIKALFPGGTITGCPKVRCMEIIAELEQCPRGAYTGSMGYINRDGSMDLNILIRTFVLQEQSAEDKASTAPAGQKLSFRAGAGLVFDSIAQRELQETRAKARGLLRALGLN